MSDRAFFVYRAYDAADELLYVGVTRQPRTRWAQHQARSDWAPYVTRTRLTGPFTQADAFVVEHDAIAAEEPWFNATHVQRGRLRRGMELLAQCKAQRPDLFGVNSGSQEWADEMDRLAAIADAEFPEDPKGRLAQYLRISQGSAA